MNSMETAPGEQRRKVQPGGVFRANQGRTNEVWQLSENFHQLLCGGKRRAEYNNW